VAAVMISSSSHSLFFHLTNPTPAVVTFREQLVLEKEVGRGGFGSVFKGTWQGRPVAIKQLHADLLLEKNQQKFDEFKQEVFLMKCGFSTFGHFSLSFSHLLSNFCSCLNHENIVRLYGITQKPLSMVMEFVPAGDLRHLLEPYWKAKVVCKHDWNQHTSIFQTQLESSKKVRDAPASASQDARHASAWLIVMVAG